MPIVTPSQFFHTLFGEPIGPGQLVLWTKSARGGSHYTYWIENLDEAARLACRYRKSRDVYFGVALQDREQAVTIARQRRPRANHRSTRGSEQSATLLTALWADLDVAGPGHARDDLPPDRESALGLLEAVPRPPSILIDTGGGFHAYWRLDKPLELATAEQRRSAKRLVHKLQAALRAAGAEQGWGVDQTANLAQLLRVPGTLNHKSSPGKPVTVELFPLGSGAGDRTCRAEDFDHLPEPAGGDGVAVLMRDPGGGRDLGPAASFRPVFAGCPYLAYCYQHRTSLPEPEWHAAITVVARCRVGDADGRRLAHRISRDHPGYTVAGTDAKVDHALAACGPRTCKQIAGLSPRAAACCAGCAHRGQIKSPIVLGRRPPSPPIASYDADPAASAHPRSVPLAHLRHSVPLARRDDAAGAAGHGTAGHDTAGSDVPDGRPEILITTREHQVNDRALAALARREPNLFQRAGMLVQVVRAAGSGPSLVKPLVEARLRELLTRHCAFVKLAAGDSRPAHPPRWTVRALLSRGSWPQVPALDGIVEGPVLRADGSVLQRRGFDAATGLVYQPNAAFEPVPESPGDDQVQDALGALREVVADFPFRDQADFAAWLSALLTPLARSAFDGPAPLNLIDANAPGTGKSLLADVCSTLLTGRGAARMSYSQDEDEIRKQITSVALQATRLVLIDNVSGAFGSATLDRALTAESWSDRLLGGNEQATMPLKATWFATGNNVALRGDTPRRCLHIRLETLRRNPERRTDFKHPRLLGWLRRERCRLLPAALTLLRAYAAAGSPPLDLSGWGSYEGWSDRVRSTVVWLGLPDPAETRHRHVNAGVVRRGRAGRAAGREQLDLVHGLAELLETLGGAASSKEILDELAAPRTGANTTSPPTYATLRAALAALFATADDRALPTPAQLSAELGSLRGRSAGGACIERQRRSYKGVLWRVQRTEKEASP